MRCFAGRGGVSLRGAGGAWARKPRCSRGRDGPEKGQQTTQLAVLLYFHDKGQMVWKVYHCSLLCPELRFTVRDDTRFFIKKPLEEGKSVEAWLRRQKCLDWLNCLHIDGRQAMDKKETEVL